MAAQHRTGPEGFEEFWSAYPRREKKRAAEDAFRWAMQNHNSDGLLLSKMLSTLAWQRANGQALKYWQMPDKWLLNERWTDENPDEAKQREREQRPKPAWYEQAMAKAKAREAAS